LSLGLHESGPGLDLVGEVEVKVTGVELGVGPAAIPEQTGTHMAVPGVALELPGCLVGAFITQCYLVLGVTGDDGQTVLPLVFLVCGH
jgi:hypothetical protein